LRRASMGESMSTQEHSARRQRDDGGRLAIGRDDPFEFAPELIHRVELWRLLRQPDEPNPQPPGQGLRLMVRVCARAIGEVSSLA
jgi:hypothetical protein